MHGLPLRGGGLRKPACADEERDKEREMETKKVVPRACGIFVRAVRAAGCTHRRIEDRGSALLVGELSLKQGTLNSGATL